MDMTGNTILITGGGSGIGRALAEAFHKLGNQVVIAGRGNNNLAEVTHANPGMQSLQVDMGSAESVSKFAANARAQFPALNVVIHCAGVMMPQDLKKGGEFESIVKTTVNINLLGPLQLTEELLPALLRQPKAAILTVSSGLAFLPAALTPTYCATKAAIHSYSQSLRYQLRDTAVQVIEVAPPYVQTTLMGERQADDPRAMPLADYISETMQIFEADPDVREVLVGRVLPLRFAEKDGPAKYEEFFENFNNQMMAAAHGH